MLDDHQVLRHRHGMLPGIQQLLHFHVSCLSQVSSWHGGIIIAASGPAQSQCSSEDGRNGKAQLASLPHCAFCIETDSGRVELCNGLAP